MFAVLFELRPRAGVLDDYLASAATLRPELERVEGFLDNVRYRSLIRDGWLLSVSSWRDEKALVRWRTHAFHHEMQGKGRERILADYHLRVGQVTRDAQPPGGQALVAQRFDETETGKGRAVTLTTARRPDVWKLTSNPDDCAQFLGLNAFAAGLIAYDVFEAVLTPGDLLLLCSWRDGADAEAFGDTLPSTTPAGGRVRELKIIRDYGLTDRREAPQYFPAVASGAR